MEGDSIFLCSHYVMPAFQRRGIGGHVLRTLLERASVESKAVTLAVAKINPALSFCLRHGFQITHDEKHKFYLRIDPLTITLDSLNSWNQKFARRSAATLLTPLAFAVT